MTTPPADFVQAPFQGFARQAQIQLVPRVKGDFTGTTDEILQWGACKWGFDVDTVRAQAVVESWWRMSVNGDAGESFGILQVRPKYHPGTWPWARDSTAFNVDYTLARRRGCYEGWSYAGTRSTGDLWGCIGMWYSGSYGSGYADYVSAVQREYAAKNWLSWRARAA
jgi:autotransporter family porin